MTVTVKEQVLVTEGISVFANVYVMVVSVPAEKTEPGAGPVRVVLTPPPQGSTAVGSVHGTGRVQPELTMFIVMLAGQLLTVGGVLLPLTVTDFTQVTVFPPTVTENVTFCAVPVAFSVIELGLMLTALVQLSVAERPTLAGVTASVAAQPAFKVDAPVHPAKVALVGKQLPDVTFTVRVKVIGLFSDSFPPLKEEQLMVYDTV